MPKLNNLHQHGIQISRNITRDTLTHSYFSSILKHVTLLSKNDLPVSYAIPSKG